MMGASRLLDQTQAVTELHARITGLEDEVQVLHGGITRNASLQAWVAKVLRLKRAKLMLNGI